MRFSLYLYESDGSWLIAKSTVGVTAQLINARVYAGVTYTIKIKSDSGYSSSKYTFKVKNYTTTRPAKVYTFTDTKGSINFRQNYNVISPHLTFMEYNHVNRFDYTAASAYTELPNCSLVSFYNHADPGRFYFKDSHFSGNSVVYSNVNNAGFGRYGEEALANVKLMMFFGCNSGDTSSIYGNLVDGALSKGVICSIGWTEPIYHDDVLEWEDKFFETLSYGYTIAFAIEEANAWMEDKAVFLTDITAQYCGSSLIDSLTLY